jgi:hypothetical protein
VCCRDENPLFFFLNLFSRRKFWTTIKVFSTVVFAYFEEVPYVVSLDFSSGVRVVCELVDEPELEKLLRGSPFETEAERWG